MDNLIDRQVAISAICSACGKIDCDKMDKCEKLQLPPANCSEFPNSSDTISRQQAIDAVEFGITYAKAINKETGEVIALFEESNAELKEAVNRIKQLPPANCSEFPNSSDTISRQQAIDICRAPHMRNADCSDFEMAIMMLPPAQPTPDQNGDLWITVPDIDKVTCIYVQESKSKFCRIFYEEQEQSEPYKEVTT